MPGAKLGLVATVTDPLGAAREALEDGDWQRAKDEFVRAVATEETASAVEGLGLACRWLGEIGSTFRAYGRAYRLYRQAGDRVGAARVALQLASCEGTFRSEKAVALGWLERAARLLEGSVPGLEHGWVELWRGHVALQLDRDPARALEHSTRAREIGSAAGLLDIEMTGLAQLGLALVSLGRVEEGMRCLDESAAAATAGEMEDLDAISSTYCYLIDACKRVRDFGRAAQWCDHVAEFSERWSDQITFAACRTHYADILIWRGAWAEAESDLLGLLGDLGALHRSRLADALVRLAELRRRQGRLSDAAELLAQCEGHLLAPLAAAALALDRDEPDEALRSVERYLRRVAPDSLTERAAGLELLVRAAAARGDLPTARDARDQLAEIAECVTSDAAQASAALAAGVVAIAEERWGDACRRLEDAVDLFTASGGRWESAQARRELARTLRALGKVDAADRELRAAYQELSRLGGAARPAEVSRAGLTRRELEVLGLVARGRSNQEIAAQLVLSVRTVERHVSSIYNKIGASGGAARAAAASYALVEGLA